MDILESLKSASVSHLPQSGFYETQANQVICLARGSRVPGSMSSSNGSAQQEEPRLRSNPQVVVVGNQWLICSVDGIELWLCITHSGYNCLH